MKPWLRISRIRIKNSHPQRSFTLIETLIVATILAFIGLGIAVTFFSGMKIWDRAKNISFAGNNTLLTFESIARELRQSINVPSIGFEGGLSEISFPSVINDSIVKLTYKFDSAKNILTRKEVSRKDILSGKEKENYSERNIMSLDEFSLGYRYYSITQKSYDWREGWTKDLGPFVAVKLKGKINGEETTKTVFIPAS